MAKAAATDPTIEKLQKQIEAHTNSIETTKKAALEAERDLTESEFDFIRNASNELEAISKKLSPLVEAAERAEAANTLALRGLNQSATQTQYLGIREAEPYRPDGEHSYFGDLIRSEKRGDQAARERVMAWHEGATRDVGTSAFAGLIPPTYLKEQYAPLRRSKRPFLDNAVTVLPLTDTGMNFVVTSQTAVTNTANIIAPAAEGAAWQESNPAYSDTTYTVKMMSGQVDVSRAVMDRGAGQDFLIFRDLMASYDTRVDWQCLNGDGTGQNHLGVRNVVGINAVPYTDASPTIGELHPKVIDGAQRIAGSNFTAASHLVGAPRRWGFIASQVDTTGRPVFGFSNANAQNNYADGGVGYGYTGNYAGLPFIADAAIPTNLGVGTNEDCLIVLAKEDVILWEEPNFRELTFEQVGGPENIRLAAYKYSLFVPGRYPTSISVISGTGLVAPTF